ncbi:MAG TPA: rhodanese-like domain-containing protein [Acidobacteriota bacterium]|jgi:rhodanese-related sulfurtransferase|nr:rhodanese-like domain-containing protein [Acidobacteriota bacterium]
MQPTKVTIDDIKGRLDRGEPLVFVDTRNPTAWSESDVKLPGAMRVPADQVQQHLRQIPQNCPVVVYCS